MSITEFLQRISTAREHARALARGLVAGADVCVARHRKDAGCTWRCLGSCLRRWLSQLDCS